MPAVLNDCGEITINSLTFFKGVIEGWGKRELVVNFPYKYSVLDLRYLLLQISHKAGERTVNIAGPEGIKAKQMKRAGQDLPVYQRSGQARPLQVRIQPLIRIVMVIYKKFFDRLRRYMKRLKDD